MRIYVKLINGSKFLMKCMFKARFDIRKIFLFLRVKPYTQLSYERLANTYELAKKLEFSRVKGCFVECGVWKGGVAAVLVYISNKFKSGRKTWLIDSFEGMPAPECKDGEFANRLFKANARMNVASFTEVKKLLFEKFKFNKKNVVIVKGWFHEVLPKVKQKIKDIALLRIDVDWYKSTKICLDNLYDNVVSGGYIIIDDYNFFPGCKTAVDEFIKERNLKIELNEIDKEGVYFQKP